MPFSTLNVNVTVKWLTMGNQVYGLLPISNVMTILRFYTLIHKWHWFLLATISHCFTYSATYDFFCFTSVLTYDGKQKYFIDRNIGTAERKRRPSELKKRRHFMQCALVRWWCREWERQSMCNVELHEQDWTWRTWILESRIYQQ